MDENIEKKNNKNDVSKLVCVRVEMTDDKPFSERSMFLKRGLTYSTPAVVLRWLLFMDSEEREKLNVFFFTESENEKSVESHSKNIMIMNNDFVSATRKVNK